MCLGVPGRLISITDDQGLRMGQVDFGGVLREVCLEAVPEAVIGDFVMIHAGFALNRMSEEEARETLGLLDELEAFHDPMEDTQ